MDIDWTGFLGRTAGEIDQDIVEESIRGKRVMVTGAGGSIGSALARRIAGAGIERLIALDIAEHGLFDLDAALGDGLENARTELIVGDVCDRALLREVFQEHRPEVVFHAAACKHVTLMEANPFAAARSNIVGTHRLLEAARETHVGQVIVLSTDKAVEPVSIMGATKRVAELLAMASTGSMKVKAVRLANVLGSSGSVVPIFTRQIERGGPLTITDPKCMRYFLTMAEAVGHLVAALAVDAPGVIVPEVGEAISIGGLARFLLGDAQLGMVCTGLRAGEKVAEEMVASNERLTLSNVPLLRVAVAGRGVSAATLDSAMEEIEKAIERRRLDRLVEAMIALVPEYEPSRQIRERVG